MITERGDVWSLSAPFCSSPAAVPLEFARHLSSNTKLAAPGTQQVSADRTLHKWHHTTSTTAQHTVPCTVTRPSCAAWTKNCVVTPKRWMCTHARNIINNSKIKQNTSLPETNQMFYGDGNRLNLHLQSLWNPEILKIYSQYTRTAPEQWYFSSEIHFIILLSLSNHFILWQFCQMQSFSFVCPFYAMNVESEITWLC